MTVDLTAGRTSVAPGKPRIPNRAPGRRRPRKNQGAAQLSGSGDKQGYDDRSCRARCETRNAELAVLAGAMAQTTTECPVCPDVPASVVPLPLAEASPLEEAAGQYALAGEWTLLGAASPAGD
jgi:hypothetical protein